MNKILKSILIFLSVTLINVGFAMPVVHFFWTMSGYAILDIGPRWAGQKFYILWLIPVCSVLLLFSLIPRFSHRLLVAPLLIILDLSLAFCVLEIVTYRISSIKAGAWFIAAGIIVLNFLFLKTIFGKRPPLED